MNLLGCLPSSSSLITEITLRLLPIIELIAGGRGDGPTQHAHVVADGPWSQ